MKIVEKQVWSAKQILQERSIIEQRRLVGLELVDLKNCKNSTVTVDYDKNLNIVMRGNGASGFLWGGNILLTWLNIKDHQLGRAVGYNLYGDQIFRDTGDISVVTNTVLELSSNLFKNPFVIGVSLTPWNITVFDLNARNLHETASKAVRQGNLVGFDCNVIPQSIQDLPLRPALAVALVDPQIVVPTNRYAGYAA